MKIELPEWLTLVKNKPGWCEVDADAMYPALLAELEASKISRFEGDLDQYWLEVAHNFCKLDVQLVMHSGYAPVDRSLHTHIRGGEGFKARWGLNAHKAGKYSELRKKPDGEAAFGRAVGLEAKELYRRIRGVVPG